MSAKKLARLAGLMLALSAIIGSAGVSASLAGHAADSTVVSSLASVEIVWN